MDSGQWITGSGPVDQCNSGQVGITVLQHVYQWTVDNGPVDQCDSGQVGILVLQYVYQWTVDNGPWSTQSLYSMSIGFSSYGVICHGYESARVNVGAESLRRLKAYRFGTNTRTGRRQIRDKPSYGTNAAR